MTSRKHQLTFEYLLASAFCAVILLTTNLACAQGPTSEGSGQFGSVQHGLVQSGDVDPGPLADKTVKTPGGTTNYLPVWTSSTTIANSIVYQSTAGPDIGIGTTSPGARLDVNGTINTSSQFNLGGLAFAFGTVSNENAFLGFAGNNSTTGTGNTATGYQSLASDRTGASNAAFGEQALFSNTTGGFNSACGAQALRENSSGGNNTASGFEALFSNTMGSSNTAAGASALVNNTTGIENTGVGEFALDSNTTGNDLTCIGYSCSTGADALSNATAIGAHAFVAQSNALVLGGTGSWGVRVGIGTSTPSNVLTIAQGAGHPVSDGWETFSSRRWKTNIETLHGSLGKVEQLRGVSYDLKANGKHEVGVIAEEVGAVVPEVVTWDQNGKDAQSVDYSRLTALLIEATKEQQRELAKALRQIGQQQNLLRKQAAAMESLKAEVREDHETLRKVKAQGDSTQPTLVANK
jgi:hypothetical protein